MRRVLLISGPVVVLLALGATVAVWHAQANDPLEPLKPYITYQATYFVPSRPSSRESSVQVWAWLDKKAADYLPTFGRHLTKDQGFHVRGQGLPSMEATRGEGVLPDDDISINYSDGDILLIYSRHTSPFEALFFSHYYKNLDYNSPTPTKP